MVWPSRGTPQLPLLLALSSSGGSADDAYAPPLQAHPMRPRVGSTAPGLYAQYKFSGAAAQSPSTDMEVEHTWVTVPDGSATDGNGVFASSQYWYEAYGEPCPNRSDHGTQCNSAGYMGTQVERGTHGGGEITQFIFSCWDADSAHKVSWTTPATCRRFGGEGTGSHCILPLHVTKGVSYIFRVSRTATNATGATWSGEVTNGATGARHLVGRLFYPHLPGRVGFGDLKVQTDDFFEYFLGGDCDSAVATGVGITGPFFHSRKTSPVQAYPSYGPATPTACNRSVVTGCIPGHGCGRPRVLLAGGHGVRRNTSNGEPLW